MLTNSVCQVLLSMFMFLFFFLSIANQLKSSISARVVSPIAVRCTLGQGLNYESFNPLGFLQPRSALALVSMAMSFNIIPGISDHSYLDLGKLTSLAAFFAAIDVSFEDENYDLTVDKSSCDVVFTLSHIGQRSFTLRFDIFFPSIKKNVTTGNMKVVAVSIETWRPSNLPDWWVEKYRKFLPSANSPLVIPRAQMPPEGKLHSISVTVQPSHLDGNLHVGWYNQVQMVLDAYTTWHAKEFGIDGNGGAFRNVKNLKLVFGRSASVGEEVDIQFHSDPQDENKIQFFALHKDTQQMITECCVEYYPSTDQHDNINVTSKL